jgi:hypothetical protein
LIDLQSREFEVVKLPFDPASLPGVIADLPDRGTRDDWEATEIMVFGKGDARLQKRYEEAYKKKVELMGIVPVPLIKRTGQPRYLSAYLDARSRNKFENMKRVFHLMEFGVDYQTGAVRQLSGMNQQNVVRVLVALRERGYVDRDETLRGRCHGYTWRRVVEVWND